MDSRLRGSIASAREDGMVRWYRELVPAAVGSHPGVSAIAVDGNVVVSGSSDGTIAVWRA